MDYTVVGFPKLGIQSFKLDKVIAEDIFGLGISIAWYGAIICLGMILAYFIISHNAKKYEGISSDSMLDYFIFTIPLGVIGARAMYVLTNLDYYDSFKKAIAVWNGGLAIYGGVLVGITVIVITAVIKKHDPFAVLDCAAPGVMIAQSLGRWGNFINGEAHGTVTNLPWGMMVNYQGPFHPTFLYESILTLTGFLIAELVLLKKRKYKGEIISFYLVWYGIGRFFIEGLRTDSLYFGSFRASQVIAIACVLAGIGITVYALKIKPTGKKTLAEETVLEVSQIRDAAEEKTSPEEIGFVSENGEEDTEDENDSN